MGRWTHSICLDCWKIKNPDRIPYVLTEPVNETCCFCGNKTGHGIYIRENPDNVPLCACLNEIK